MVDKQVTASTLFSLFGLLFGVFNMIFSFLPAYIPYLVVIASFIYAIIIYRKFRNDPTNHVPSRGGLIISSLALMCIIIVPVIVTIWFFSGDTSLTIVK